MLLVGSLSYCIKSPRIDQLEPQNCFTRGKKLPLNLSKENVFHFVFFFFSFFYLSGVELQYCVPLVFVTFDLF